MTDLELIFTMLGEASTTEIAREKDTQGFAPNRSAAKQGGNVAGNARKELEAKSGRAVVSRDSFLGLAVEPRQKRVAGKARPSTKRTTRQ